MDFLFRNSRNPLQQRTYDAAAKSKWQVKDLFAGAEVSHYQDEASRLAWATPLVSMAFSEATSLYGFVPRITGTKDMSLKLWLIMQLNDEAKHTEGFSALLRYLYPSHRENMAQFLAPKRELIAFFGVTQKCSTLLEWMMCTQIIEVLGKHAYTALRETIADQKAQLFLKNVIIDESRHIAYLGNVIAEAQDAMSPIEKAKSEAFFENALKRARQIFETKKKQSIFESYEKLGIDTTKFCDVAAAELRRKLL